MIEAIADTEHDDDWATPNAKMVIKIKSTIWMVVGIAVIGFVIIAAFC